MRRHAIEGFVKTLIAVIAASGPLYAREDFFPIGAFTQMRLEGSPGSPTYLKTFALVDSAQQCGFNIISLGNMHDSPTSGDTMLARALWYVKERGLKCFLYTAPRSGGSPSHTRHNLERFASGMYERYQAESHPYFSHPVGTITATDVVCEPGIMGYALYRNNTNPGWKHLNITSFRMPFVDTTAGAQWWHFGKTEYTIRFRLKYQNQNPRDPTVPVPPVALCRLQMDTIRVVNGQEYRGVVDSLLITTDSFDRPNQYKTFSLKFIRLAGQSRFVDFPIYVYGNRRVFIDYVEMQDAVYDSLSSGKYDQYITSIAKRYTSPTSPYRDIVYRYYLYDEPVRSQLGCYRLINERLRKINSHRQGFAIVCPTYPTSFGSYAAANPAIADYYFEFIQRTNPQQLAIDILPLYGDLGDCMDAPHTGYGPRGYITPEDSGRYFQQAMDVFCRLSQAANTATKPRGIPWWVQLQAFGDYLDSADRMTSGRWRLPTARELKCMANLAIAHGVKGIFYYRFNSGRACYFSYDAHPDTFYHLGLVDPLGGVWERDRELYLAAKEINGHASTLGPTLLRLVCDTTFRGDPPTGALVTGISDSLVQCGLFHHMDDTRQKYLYLVNRHCLPTDTVTFTITLNYAPIGFSQYYMVDVYTGRAVSGLLSSGVNANVTLKLGPGDGALYRLIPIDGSITVNVGQRYLDYKFCRINNSLTLPTNLKADRIQIIQKYWVGDITPPDTSSPDISGRWAADTSAWLAYSPKIIHKIIPSAQSRPNIFEVRYKLNSNLETPTFSFQIFFNEATPARSFRGRSRSTEEQPKPTHKM